MFPELSQNALPSKISGSYDTPPLRQRNPRVGYWKSCEPFTRVQEHALYPPHGRNQIPGFSGRFRWSLSASSTSIVCKRGWLQNNIRCRHKETFLVFAFSKCLSASFWGIFDSSERVVHKMVCMGGGGLNSQLRSSWKFLEAIRSSHMRVRQMRDQPIFISKAYAL